MKHNLFLYPFYFAPLATLYRQPEDRSLKSTPLKIKKHRKYGKLTFPMSNRLLFTAI